MLTLRFGISLETPTHFLSHTGLHIVFASYHHPPKAASHTSGTAQRRAVCSGTAWLALGLCGCPAQAEHHISLGIFKCGVSVRPGTSDACLLGHRRPHWTARLLTPAPCEWGRWRPLQPLSPFHQPGDLGGARSPSHCGYVQGEPAGRARHLVGLGLLAQPPQQAVRRHRIRALGSSVGKCCCV